MKSRNALPLLPTAGTANDTAELATKLAMTLDWLALALLPLQYQWWRPVRARWARRTSKLLARRARQLHAAVKHGATLEDSPALAQQVHEAFHLAQRTTRQLRPSATGRAVNWLSQRYALRQAPARYARGPQTEPADILLAKLETLRPQLPAQDSASTKRTVITTAAHLASVPAAAANRAIQWVTAAV